MNLFLSLRHPHICFDSYVMVHNNVNLQNENIYNVKFDKITKDCKYPMFFSDPWSIDIDRRLFHTAAHFAQPMMRGYQGAYQNAT